MPLWSMVSRRWSTRPKPISGMTRRLPVPMPVAVPPAPPVEPDEAVVAHAVEWSRERGRATSSCLERGAESLQGYDAISHDEGMEDEEDSLGLQTPLPLPPKLATSQVAQRELAMEDSEEEDHSYPFPDVEEESLQKGQGRKRLMLRRRSWSWAMSCAARGGSVGCGVLGGRV